MQLLLELGGQAGAAKAAATASSATPSTAPSPAAPSKHVGVAEAHESTAAVDAGCLNWVKGLSSYEHSHSGRECELQIAAVASLKAEIMAGTAMHAAKFGAATTAAAASVTAACSMHASQSRTI